MGECFLTSVGTTQTSTPQIGSSGDSGGLPLGTIIYTLNNGSYTPQGCLPVTGTLYDGTDENYSTFFKDYITPTTEGSASLKRCYFRSESSTTYTYNYDIYYSTPVPSSQWGENTSLSDDTLVAVYGNDHSLIEVPEFTPDLNKDWTLNVKLKFFTFQEGLTALFGTEIVDSETQFSIVNRVYLSSDRTQIGIATGTSNSAYTTLPRALEVGDIVTITVKSYASNFNMSIQCTIEGEDPSTESFMVLGTHMDMSKFSVGFVDGLVSSYTGTGNIGLLFSSNALQEGEIIWEARTSKTTITKTKDYSYSTVETTIPAPKVLVKDDSLWQQEKADNVIVGSLGLATNVVTQSSNSALSVGVSNKASLVSNYLSYYGQYWLSYDDEQQSWTTNGDDPISLSTIGISVSGTPVGGDYITITYSQGTQFRTPYLSNGVSCKTDSGSDLGTKSNGSIPEVGGNPSFVSYRAFILVSSVGGGSSIGIPIFTFERALESNEVWLEGAVVKQANYSKLYEIYGTTFNTGGEASDSFRLPDLRGRTIQGVSNNNTITYVSAGLPNITGSFGTGVNWGTPVVSGAFSVGALDGGTSGGRNPSTGYRVLFDASTFNPIYGASDTVTVNHVQVYVKTRYK